MLDSPNEGREFAVVMYKMFSNIFEGSDVEELFVHICDDLLMIFACFDVLFCLFIEFDHSVDVVFYPLIGAFIFLFVHGDFFLQC